jgi:hypothetical protein
MCYCAPEHRSAEQFWELPQTHERDVWLGPGDGLRTRSARDIAEWPVSAICGTTGGPCRCPSRDYRQPAPHGAQHRGSRRYAWYLVSYGCLRYPVCSWL